MEECINNDKSLEEKMVLIKEIINKLERDDNTLEESFNLYKEGMQYLLDCNKSIDRVEKELIVLEGNDNGIQD